MNLQKVLTYKLHAMRGPLHSTLGSPLGERQYWEMSEATLEGSGIHAQLALPGGDWMLVSDDGFWRPDVRVQFVTDDGATILLHYTGLVEQTEKFKSAAANANSTEWDDQYMRMIFHFDTGTTKYAWLNQSVFVGRGRLAVGNQIEYEIYKVI